MAGMWYISLTISVIASCVGLTVMQWIEREVMAQRAVELVFQSTVCE
jgi:hypothetical protein